MMEPQEEFCACRKCKKRSCFDIVLFILFVAIAVVLGLIFGANFSTAILGALPALIVLVAILALLIIINLILLACENRRC